MFRSSAASSSSPTSPFSSSDSPSSSSLSPIPSSLSHTSAYYSFCTLDVFFLDDKHSFFYYNLPQLSRITTNNSASYSPASDMSYNTSHMMFNYFCLSDYPVNDMFDMDEPSVNLFLDNTTPPTSNAVPSASSSPLLSASFTSCAVCPSFTSVSNSLPFDFRFSCDSSLSSKSPSCPSLSAYSASPSSYTPSPPSNDSSFPLLTPDVCDSSMDCSLGPSYYTTNCYHS